MELNLTGTSGHGTPEEFANLSVVMITDEDIFIDNGAIHGKSRIERGVDFRTYTAPEQVPNAKRIASVWVTLKRGEGGMGYSGVCAAEIFVNGEERVGYKSMALLVNTMDRAVKGRIDLALLTDEQRARLAAFMQELRPDLWENASDEVKSALLA